VSSFGDLPQGEMCELMHRATVQLIDIIQTPGANRHDTTCEGVLTLLRFAHRGHTGVEDAIGQVRDAFLGEVVGRGSDSRTERQAENEFRRFFVQSDGTSKAASIILASPTPADERGCWCGVRVPLPAVPQGAVAMCIETLNSPHASADELSSFLASYTRNTDQRAAGRRLGWALKAGPASLPKHTVHVVVEVMAGLYPAEHGRQLLENACGVLGVREPNESTRKLLRAGLGAILDVKVGAA
jgi:hypothetical protein